MEFFTLKTK